MTFTQLQMQDRGRSHDFERPYYDSLVIILTTLESCLSNQSKETARFEEAQNVKLLLREICQYMGPLPDDKSENASNAAALRSLSSKVLFALSQTHFGAVFGRITSRLQEVSTSNDEAPDYSDIDLIQHVDLNVHRLLKLLAGECKTGFGGENCNSLTLTLAIAEVVQKFRAIKKAGQVILLCAFERALWNWIECHPIEFADLQTKPNEELAKHCDILFDILETHVENKKSRSSIWPLQIMLLILCPVS